MINLNPSIEKIIEELSLDLVMCDSGEEFLFDRLLSKIKTLVKLTEGVANDEQKALYAVSGTACRYIEENIHKEDFNKASLLSVIVKAVTAMQSILNGTKIQEIELPAGFEYNCRQDEIYATISEISVKLHEISSAASGAGNTPVSDAVRLLADILGKVVNNQRPACNSGTKMPEDFIKSIRNVNVKTIVQSGLNPDQDSAKNTGKIVSVRQDIHEEISSLEVVSDEYALACDAGLLNDFIAEASEHAESVDLQLLILEKDKNNKDAINTIFRCFHTLKSLSSFLELHDIFALVKEAEGMLHKARKGDLFLDVAEMDVLFEVVDMLKKQIGNMKEAILKSEKMKVEPALNGLLSKICSICGKIAPKDTFAVLNNDKSYSNGDGCSDFRPLNGNVNLDRLDSTQPHAQMREMLKIDSEKFDRLIETIGEIVIAESMIKTDNGVYLNASGDYIKNLGHLNKTTKRLHELGLSLRMVPLNALFQKMARVTRDLAKRHNKEIDFLISGEETEIDRAVAAKISDPLIHMLRNAVDHGIETKEERIKANKPAVALVKLNAYHKGGNVYIEVSDDGRGLDMEKILSRAVENGLIKADAKYTDNEIYSLIFKPGFSTSSVVTDTSGRGVGMDVVKKNVEELRGKVDIYTKKSHGAKFTISMPLTTAIIEAMVVRLGTEKYLLPTLSIIESVKADCENIFPVVGKGLMLSLRGQLIPVFSLRKLFFGSKNSYGQKDGEIIVIVEDETQKAGIIIDELIDQQQIVVKSMGNGIEKIDGIGGCTIMADGKVGLIIDVSEIVRFSIAGGGEKR
jgi:two-component system chemotaxis sensor kinase CheA